MTAEIQGTQFEKDEIELVCDIVRDGKKSGSMSLLDQLISDLENKMIGEVMSESQLQEIEDLNVVFSARVSVD